LSPNRAATKAEVPQRYRFERTIAAVDLMAAALFHLLVVALLLATAHFTPAPLPEEQRIEVALISPAELAALEQASTPPPAEEAIAPEQLPAAEPEPELPALPPENAKPAPSEPPKPKPAAHAESKPAKAAEEPFDPFKPMQSSSNRKAATMAPVTPVNRQQIISEQMRQISGKEYNRYVGMLQQSVQKQWKVPAALPGKPDDPVVEMELNPDGTVKSARILVSSGSEPLDASLLRAIHAAAPYTVPKEQFELFRFNKIRFHPLR